MTRIVGGIEGWRIGASGFMEGVLGGESRDAKVYKGVSGEPIDP
jgi:hypothetical protein